MITIATELLHSYLEGHAISPGGEGTPYYGLYGEVPPERGIFFRV